MSDYQLSVIGHIWPALIYLIVVSGIYWINTKSILDSAHGVIIFIAFIYALIISEFIKQGSAGFYYWPLWILILLGLVSAIYSLRSFKGKTWVHLIHLLTLMSAFRVFLIGGLALGYDYRFSVVEDMLPVLVYLITVSVIYWVKTKSILESIHGLIIFVAFFYAMIFSKFTETDPTSIYDWPFIILILLGVVSAIYSLRGFKDKTWVHLVHFLTLISAFGVLFVGGLTLAHDSL